MAEYQGESESAPSPAANWWLILVARILLALFGLVFVTFLVFANGVGDFIIGVTAILVLFYAVVFPLASVAAVYYDREYVSTVSEWTPSWGYYAVVSPGVVAELIAVVYLYQRHRYVGTP